MSATDIDPAFGPDFDEGEPLPPMPGSERDLCACGHSRAAHVGHRDLWSVGECIAADCTCGAYRRGK